MKFIDFLRKINSKVSNKVIFGRSLGYQEQYDYLHSLPEPKNDIERSYNQYLCQVFSCENRFSFFLKNAISIVMLPFYHSRKYRLKIIKTEIENPLVYIAVNNKFDMLPDDIYYSEELIGVMFGDGFYLDAEDFAYLEKIRKAYPYSYYFVYKVLLKIGLYSSIIKMYNPSEIIVNDETSFTSSILTNYCETKGVKHVNVMHGEKIYWIRDAFFRFTKCYVWSEYHSELFRSMRAIESKYVIFLPPAMRFDVLKVKLDDREIVDYKFYLSYETQQTLEMFKKVVDEFEQKGKKCMLRPHPVYTNLKLLKKTFPEEIIEDTKEVEIKQSILTTRNVVAIYSTVLRQAYYAGVRVIVDDCTNVAKYREMKDLKFWLYEVEHALLSEELKV